MTSILYIERRFWEWVSIEKVFRQVAENLPRSEFTTSFQQLEHGNNLSGVLNNLLRFRPRAANIFHITGQVHYMSLVLPSERTVLTIHDLRFLHEKRGAKRLFLKKLFLDWPLRRLRYVTAVSDATRDEIVQVTGCDPELIRVVENPLREVFVHDREHEFNQSRPRILQVGTTTNKNIPRVIRALEGIDCELVIVGTLDRETTEALEISNLTFENKKSLDDAELAAEYSRADIVTFVSTYEGFGLPIIEAQAIGRPVVTSDRSPMKEVAGRDAAVLVDPESVESIREGILHIIRDRPFRERVISNGLENVLRFRPNAIAERYAELYREIIDARQSLDRS